ncbi:major inositol transporter-like SP family MFS transporter [Clostridium algifaecis]|uniref:Major inositol transporter-like SP family MFS transporter n=1 Tax=Clostridium algifaecis TaxID=1472040 RepID=A0ABS4KXH8_9CLOT|nr:sugar porter family MFS transporter [Clostridium algifaecis]MBP2034101.1 major inositol transporter-like SP family MFS transporter [Clostridium algifaecis]
MEQAVQDKSKRRFLRKISILATFGSLLFGYDSGVINGALSFISRKDQLNLTPLTEGFVTSSLLLGAALGAVIMGRFSDKYGRKKILKLLAAIFFFSTIGCALSPTASIIIVCRFVVGLGVGGVSVVVPTLLAEMAPTELRGSIVSQDQLMIVTGQLLAYVFNCVLGNISSNPGIWRYMIALSSIPAVILWFGMLVVPETPRWLAANGRVAEALEVLKEVRNEQAAEAEIKEIQINIEAEKHLERATFKDLGTPWIRRIVIIGCVIALIQQFAGVNVMMYYGTTLLEKAGFGTKTALIANIGNGIVSVISSWFYMHVMANRCNRRTVILFGYCGTTVIWLIISVASHVFAGSAILPYMIITFTMMFLAIDQATIGPLTWLLLSEIFPQRVRGIGFGVATFFNWMGNFSVGLTFPVLIAAFGLSKTFIIFIVLGFVCIVCVAKMVPETRGKSLEEMEKYFRNIDAAQN